MKLIPPLKIYYWLPRFLAIFSIVIVSTFALDAFGAGVSHSQQWQDFIIHLVPTYLLVVILVVAWKWEYLGGIIFLVIGILATPYVFVGNYHLNQSLGLSFTVILLMTIPFIIIGALFLVSYRKHKNLDP